MSTSDKHSRSTRSKFSVAKVIDAKPATKDSHATVGKVFIVDHDEGLSVTNDAEAVCEYLHEAYPHYRIIYRDTTGKWDELVHTSGQFMNFAPYGGNEQPK